MLPASEILLRAGAGVVVAGGTALAARRAHALSASGAVAATFAGGAAVASGWSWGILLVSLFITATALSKIGESRKRERVGSIVAKGGQRDAAQVFANGGVYVAAALGNALFPSPSWYAVAIGALAASAADTWATEVGTLARSDPISIASGQRVPPGTSGGITLLGAVAGAGGAVFVAAAGWLAGWPVPFAAAAVGGIAGALADSLLGATLQSRRWCERCGQETERIVHTCNTKTKHVRGIESLDNDAVNALCSGVGALVALLMA